MPQGDRRENPAGDIVYEPFPRQAYRPSRECTNVFGKRKWRYWTLERAIAGAHRCRERWHKHYLPYRCGQCGAWHVGVPRMDSALYYELGDRAFFNLLRERDQGSAFIVEHLFERMTKRAA